MKLKEIYETLISRGIGRVLDPSISYDKHRIVPGHKGGTYVPTNVSYLTRKEHKLVHKLRYKLHGEWQDYQAARVLGQKDYTHPWNKGISTGPISNEIKLKLSNALKGKSYTQLYGEEKAVEMKRLRSERMKETRLAHSEPWNKGKKVPILSEIAKQRKYSLETRKKMSESAKNRKRKTS